VRSQGKEEKGERVVAEGGSPKKNRESSAVQVKRWGVRNSRNAKKGNLRAQSGFGTIEKSSLFLEEKDQRSALYRQHDRKKKSKKKIDRPCAWLLSGPATPTK